MEEFDDFPQEMAWSLLRTKREALAAGEESVTKPDKPDTKSDTKSGKKTGKKVTLRKVKALGMAVAAATDLEGEEKSEEGKGEKVRPRVAKRRGNNVPTSPVKSSKAISKESVDSDKGSQGSKSQPPRKKSAWSIFCAARREDVRSSLARGSTTAGEQSGAEAALTSVSLGAVQTALAAAWKSLSPAERAVFDLAATTEAVEDLKVKQPELVAGNKFAAAAAAAKK